jgi:hypothetical protein
MTYPDYPNNRLIVNGIDLTIRFQLVLIDGYTLEPPEPKLYTVDVPGGDGVIDLTESLRGDVSYKQRKQEFTLLIIDMKDEQTFEARKTMVSNFLHGRSFDYQMTMDPGYTYHGRFSVDTYAHSMFQTGILGAIKITIEADPYKSRGKMTYSLNATGGKMFYFPSGRKKVHPVIQCDEPCRVNFKGKDIVVGSGTYRLNDVLFEEGINELYINSRALYSVKWEELSATDGNLKMTWQDAADKKYRWDDLQRLNYEGANQPRSWEEVAETRWNEFAQTPWSAVDFRDTKVPATSVGIQYEWKDL